MDIKTLEEKVRSLHGSQRLDYTLRTPREKEILAKTVKLNEEVGELCNDILSILRLQRKAKLDRFDRRNIYQEFADVLLTLMQLAVVTRVDMDRAVNDKLRAITQRLGNESKTK